MEQEHVVISCATGRVPEQTRIVLCSLLILLLFAKVTRPTLPLVLP